MNLSTNLSLACATSFGRQIEISVVGQNVDENAISRLEIKLSQPAEHLEIQVHSCFTSPWKNGFEQKFYLHLQDYFVARGLAPSLDELRQIFVIHDPATGESVQLSDLPIIEDQNVNNLWNYFVQFCQHSPPYGILDIGGRERSGNSPRQYFPENTYQALDIEPGPGVDIIADAHNLDTIESSSCYAVLSLSTFEHLRKPWLVAAEIVRILMPGGLLYVQTHQTIGMHDLPHDYFRFSAAALESLFEFPEVEIVASQLTHPVYILPFITFERHGQHLNSAGYEASVLIARRKAIS